MLNSVDIVGKISKPVYYIDEQAFINVLVKKPVSSRVGMEDYDTFSICLWPGIASFLSDVAKIGTMICFRGRLVMGPSIHDATYSSMIVAEVVEILDKHFTK